MKGKRIFTINEADEIRSLISQKVRSSKNDQKKIRAKLRRFCFYVTDFDKSQSGFTVIDFENLIETRQIIISGNNKTSSSNHRNIHSEIGNKENHNQKRSKYKPDIIKVLYIGESPPSGGTFFYSANSNLFCHMNKAFKKVFGDTVGENFTFLGYFMTSNCYLDDLCLEPVNKKSIAEKYHLRQKGIEPLAERIKFYSPEAIIILMKSIETQVKEAISKSGIKINHIFVTSFPSHNQSNIDNFIAGNVKALEKLLSLEIIQKINTTSKNCI